jgi:hypothetical protein
MDSPLISGQPSVGQGPAIIQCVNLTAGPAIMV